MKALPVSDIARIVEEGSYIPEEFITGIEVTYRNDHGDITSEIFDQIEIDRIIRRYDVMQFRALINLRLAAEQIRSLYINIIAAAHD